MFFIPFFVLPAVLLAGFQGGLSDQALQGGQPGQYWQGRGVLTAPLGAVAVKHLQRLLEEADPSLEGEVLAEAALDQGLR